MTQERVIAPARYHDDLIGFHNGAIEIKPMPAARRR
jgi:hypothetical protein